MCTNKLIKWHSKYFCTVPDIISAMRKNCVWFLLFKSKATALALTQIKLLAPLLTLLQLVPLLPRVLAQMQVDTPWKELVTDWSQSDLAQEEQGLKYAPAKWHFECQSVSSSSANCSCILSLGKMKTWKMNMLWGVIYSHNNHSQSTETRHS